MPTAVIAHRLRFFLILSVLAQWNLCAYCQTVPYPIKQWVKDMSDKNGRSAAGIEEVVSALKNKDSVEVIRTLNQIEQKGNFKNNYFKARFLATKARTLFGYATGKDRVNDLLKPALNAAYETNNDSLISEISWTYGISSYLAAQMEAATTYCLFAAEQDEKIGKKTEAYKCWYLGILLYRTRDYQKAMQYTQLSINRENDTSRDWKRAAISRYNTVALCYQKMGKYDSAFFYYDEGMKIAQSTNDNLWQAIISGNKGQIYYSQKKYAIAKPLLFMDYSVGKINNEQSSAANSLQWIARISLTEGKKDSALMQIREALRLVEQRPDFSADSYRQNIYSAATEIYRSLDDKDSVLKYSELYSNLHDSIERSIASSRLEMSRIKLENLQNGLAIRNLQKEKEATELRRNFILLAIVLVAVIAIFMLYRQRQKLAHRQQMAEAEAESARQQMQLFRQSIIEKTNLIEKLQEQVQDKETTAEQLQILEELSQQTILTETDWDKFKRLFEKIYPGFFNKLKEKAIDITVAEQRMAALTRLHLTPKQMASMLGISPLSVHKTRQRLRQRLQITSESNLEETITSL
jgi:DNA-binding CsgD family transcriptional regulator